MNQELAALNAELERLRVVAQAANRLVKALWNEEADEQDACTALEVALAVAGYDPSPQT